MRVVAGLYRGRTLHAPPGDAVRPTSDKVRGAIFNVLATVDGLRVLDLYAGTGALGIEALSRGAAEATFVDTETASIEGNLAPLELEAEVVRGDVEAWLGRARARAYDLVFADPPYSSAPRLGDTLTRLLPAVLSQNARIVTESDKRTPLELGFPLEFERDYGHTRIRIHRV